MERTNGTPARLEAPLAADLQRWADNGGLMRHLAVAAVLLLLSGCTTRPTQRGPEAGLSPDTASLLEAGLRLELAEHDADIGATAARCVEVNGGQDPPPDTLARLELHHHGVKPRSSCREEALFSPPGGYRYLDRKTGMSATVVFANVLQIECDRARVTYGRDAGSLAKRTKVVDMHKNSGEWVVISVVLEFVS